MVGMTATPQSGASLQALGWGWRLARAGRKTARSPGIPRADASPCTKARWQYAYLTSLYTLSQLKVRDVSDWPKMHAAILRDASIFSTVLTLLPHLLTRRCRLPPSMLSVPCRLLSAVRFCNQATSQPNASLLNSKGEFKMALLERRFSPRSDCRFWGRIIVVRDFLFLVGLCVIAHARCCIQTCPLLEGFDNPLLPLLTNCLLRFLQVIIVLAQFNLLFPRHFFLFSLRAASHPGSGLCLGRRSTL